jgi:hypothetical protein
VQGGARPFRGTGADARRYVESDRSTADDYYLSERDALASWTLSDAHGEVTAAADLGPEAYAAWVDWAHPLTGERMGVPRAAGDGRKGSPRFQEMIVNAPKSLSVAAALHPDVSAALDRAQADAAGEIRRYLALHATTRVGPRGAQQVVPVEQLQTVGIAHPTGAPQCSACDSTRSQRTPVPASRHGATTGVEGFFATGDGSTVGDRKSVV